MDNVTHTLFALTLARIPLGRGGRATTAALVLASNAPDIDIVATLGGAAEYLKWHRGPTHGPLGIIGLGLVTAGMVWGGRRLIARRWDPPSGGPVPIRLKPDPTYGAPDHTHAAPDSTNEATFAVLLVASIVGVVAHILMDLPTSYGTRLLSPFSWRWFAMDLMPIIDVYLWIILAAGLLLGSMGARSREMRRQTAAAALVLMAANYGIRAVSHQQALSMASRLYGPTLPAPCEPSAAFGSLLDSWPQSGAPQSRVSRCLMDTGALPDFLSPFEWRIIARQPDAYEMYGINVLDARLGNAEASSPVLRNDAAHIKNPWNALIAKAASTRSAQVLLGFSRTPVARVLVEPSGATTIQFTDLRFATGLDNPQFQTRRSSLFTATVRFGPHDELLEERLGQ